MISTLQYELAHTPSTKLIARRVVDELRIQTCQLLTARMLGDGWFPIHIEMLSLSVDAAAMCSANLLGPPKNAKNYRRCSKDKWSADQILASDYVTVHITKGCDYDHLAPSLGKIASILESGGIPYVSISLLAEQEHLMLEIEEFRDGETMWQSLTSGLADLEI